MRIENNWTAPIILALALAAFTASSCNVTQNGNLSGQKNGVTTPAGLAPTAVPTPDCSDGTIVNDIYAEIAKHAVLRVQLGHIQVKCNAKKVTLYGWANNNIDWKKIVAIAQAHPCVNNSLPDTGKFYDSPNNDLPKPGNCPEGTIACGGLCLSPNECGVDPGPTKTTPTP